MTKQKIAKGKISGKSFRQMWIEARKDPNFVKEMKEFVKASTSVYNLD